MIMRLVLLSLTILAFLPSGTSLSHHGHRIQQVLDAAQQAHQHRHVQAQHQLTTTTTCDPSDVVCGPGTDESCAKATLAWDQELAALMIKNKITPEPEVGPWAPEVDEKSEKLLMEVSSSQDTETEMGVGVMPIGPLIPNFANVREPRNILRGVPIATPELMLPVPGALPMGAVVPTATGYLFDAYQRVTSAKNYIHLRTNQKLPARVVYWCDAAYFHTPGLAARVPPQPLHRTRTHWHSGHILAARLGGSNTDPLNFIPQHQKSNSAGGVWWRLEMIAGRAKARMEALGLVDAAGAPCQIQVTPRFLYPADPVGAAAATPAGPYMWMPSGGTYTIELDTVCGVAFGGIPAGSINNLEKVMWKWLNPPHVGGFTVAGPGADIFQVVGKTGFRFTFNWQNYIDKPTVATHPLLFFP